jgi:VanZ family protein
LLVLGFITAQLPRVSQALSTMGASPAPIALKPLYVLQLSMGYLGVAVPSYAARVAINVRFLQRQGIAVGAALATGALDVMTTFFIEVIGITSLLLFTPASLDLDLREASDAVVRLLMIALALTAGILFGGRVPGATSWIVPPWDKVVHACAYASIAACWSVAAGGRRVALAIAITVATGGLDEWLQRSLPGREADVTDLVADAVGAAVGASLASILVLRAWQRFRRMRIALGRT